MKEKNPQPYDIRWSKGHTSLGVDFYYLGADKEKEFLFAVESNLLNNVKDLLDSGVSIETKNYFGATPLMIAAQFGHTELVDFLIKKGANIEATNNVGMTALILAASSGQLNSVRLLLDKGAKIDASDGFQRTALKAAASKAHIEIVEFLVNERKCKVPVDILDYTGVDLYSKNPQDFSKLVAFFKSLNLNINEHPRGSNTGYTIHRGSDPGTHLKPEEALLIKNDIVYAHLRKSQDKSNIDTIGDQDKSNIDIIVDSANFISGTLLGKIGVVPLISYVKDHINNVNLNVPLSKYYIDNFESMISFKSLAMFSTSTLTFTTSNMLGNSMATSFILSKVTSDIIDGNYNKDVQSYATEVTQYLATMITSSAINIVLVFPHHHKHSLEVTTLASIMPNLIELAGSIAYKAGTEGYKASIDLYHEMIGNVSDTDHLL